MSSATVDDLERYLCDKGIAWAPLDRTDYLAAVDRWKSIFANAFLPGMTCREGPKARHAFRQVEARQFLILQMANSGCPPFASRAQASFGYRCTGDAVPDLSTFNHLEIAVVDSESTWTMAHTHEDDSLGGPYFILRSWVESADVTKALGKRYPRHRFPRKRIGKHI
jgi:hypothetical protein